MAVLPSEIVLEVILPKLPVKSLLRFKSVSKQFETLISSPNFILRHSLSDSATNRLLITFGECGLHLSDIDSPENPPVPLPLPECFRSFSLLSDCIIGCCNGLLLLVNDDDIYNSIFMVINPCTGFYTMIPFRVRSTSFISYGFGYDTINDDYIIVILDEFFGICIVNLKYKLWRILDYNRNNVPTVYEPAIVCNNHLCHWLIWCELKKKHGICCFDLCIENWTNDVPLPDYSDFCRGNRNGVTRLRVLNGFLSVLTRNNTNTGCDGYNVCVMCWEISSNLPRATEAPIDI